MAKALKMIQTKRLIIRPLILDDDLVLWFTKKK